MRTREVEAGLTTLSAEIGTMTPIEFAVLTKAEYERWAYIVAASVFMAHDLRNRYIKYNSICGLW